MFYGSDTARRLRGGASHAPRMAGFSLKTSEKRKGRYRYKQYPPFPLRFSLEKTGNVLFSRAVSSQVHFEKTGNVLFSRAVSSQVHSALRGLTSVFGMGTGGSLLLSSPVWLSVFLAHSQLHSTVRRLTFPFQVFISPFVIKPSTY